jgi:hypothetical protein
MARTRSIDDLGTLQMALVGFQIEKQRIEQKIQELRAQLKSRGASISQEPGEAAAPRKRELSEAARKRIAMAQKRRWAEHRKRAAAAKAQAAKPKAQAAGNSSAQ